MDIARPQQFKAQVSEHILINDKFQYLHLELLEPHQLNFVAGQYVSFDLGEGYRRSYSIASSPAINHAFDLCVDVSPKGKGSDFLRKLRPGDKVQFLAPLGKFTMAPEDTEKEKKLLFVATGSGITPLRSMILDLLEVRQDKRPIQLHWGLRHVEDMFWEEDFRLKHSYFTNFHFHLTLSKPPEHWPLCSGYVSDCVRSELELGSDWGVYICGSKVMIEEVTRLVIGMGVPEEQIHFEKFF
jgi:CDP-4-dehydro-6-deoxyglucose reductase